MKIVYSVFATITFLTHRNDGFAEHEFEVIIQETSCVDPAPLKEITYARYVKEAKEKLNYLSTQRKNSHINFIKVCAAVCSCLCPGASLFVG